MSTILAQWVANISPLNEDRSLEGTPVVCVGVLIFWAPGCSVRAVVVEFCEL